MMNEQEPQEYPAGSLAATLVQDLGSPDPGPSTVSYHLFQFLTDSLTDCAEAFDGDLDQVLVLAVLRQRFLGAKHMARLDPDKAGDMIWMAALRVADVTGLPRETVRRKLMILEARGLIQHNARRGWALVGNVTNPEGGDGLAELERHLLRRLLRLLGEIQPHLR